MPARLETGIRYSAKLKIYIFYDPDQDQLVRSMQPDSPEYFTWLEGL